MSDLVPPKKDINEEVDKLLDNIEKKVIAIESESTKPSKPSKDVQIDNSSEQEEEDCPSCRYNVGIGLSISICKQAKIEGLDCDELKQKYINNELSPLEIMNTLISQMELANRETNKLEQQISDLKELKQLMRLTEQEQIKVS